MKKTTNWKAFLQTARDMYTPGNIVYSAYWNEYDLVLAISAEGFNVQVIRCDSKGIPIDGARIRSHATYPDKRDYVAGVNIPELQRVLDRMKRS